MTNELILAGLIKCYKMEISQRVYSWGGVCPTLRTVADPVKILVETKNGE